LQDIKAIIPGLHQKCGKVFPGTTVIEGIHGEGPIIQTSGGLPDSELPNVEEFERQIHSLLPSLKIMTISPTLEKKIDYGRFKVLLDNGVVPALGHDILATEDDILPALKMAHDQHKQVHITHMYNVSKIHHRDVGLVNFGLLSKYPEMEKYRNITEPSVEIIGDLIHVHPLAIQLALQSKDHKKIAFITDAIMDGACEGSTVLYCGRKMVNSNKRVYLENTTTLAGSCTNLLEVFQNLTQVLKIPIPSAVPMLSENPARISGLDHTGILKEGKRGDILVFDTHVQLQTVLINGEVAWHRT